MDAAEWLERSADREDFARSVYYGVRDRVERGEIALNSSPGFRSRYEQLHCMFGELYENNTEPL